MFHDPGNVTLILICHHHWSLVIVKIYIATRWLNQHPQLMRNQFASLMLARHSFHDVRRQKFYAVKRMRMKEGENKKITENLKENNYFAIIVLLWLLVLYI